MIGTGQLRKLVFDGPGRKFLPEEFLEKRGGWGDAAEPTLSQSPKYKPLCAIFLCEFVNLRSETRKENNDLEFLRGSSSSPMSLSPSHSLYCSEVADLSDIIPFPYLESSDESFIQSLFDSELDGMLGSERLPVLPECLRARRDIVSWMLKVHSYYNFRPETAYLSVTYLDRFLCIYDLPRGKEWSLQLLSVACISIAAKMEETTVPLLLDLQVMEPRFLFTAMTVQKMELLVMPALKWRLRIVTPFSFLDYFISKLPCFYSQFHIFSNVSDLILSSCRVMGHLDFLPSSIAAAALFWATGKNVDDHTLEHLHKRINKEMVKRCHYLMKQSICSMAHIKRQRLEPVPPSPDGVLDADISELKCGGEDSK